MCELRGGANAPVRPTQAMWPLSVQCQWRLLRDFRNWLRDFCATFRENDVEQYRRKLARRAFATNKIKDLDT